MFMEKYVTSIDQENNNFFKIQHPHLYLLKLLTTN